MYTWPGLLDRELLAAVPPPPSCFSISDVRGTIANAQASAERELWPVAPGRRGLACVWDTTVPLRRLLCSRGSRAMFECFWCRNRGLLDVLSALHVEARRYLSMKGYQDKRHLSNNKSLLSILYLSSLSASWSSTAGRSSMSFLKLPLSTSSASFLLCSQSNYSRFSSRTVIWSCKPRNMHILSVLNRRTTQKSLSKLRNSAYLLYPTNFLLWVQQFAISRGI